MIKLASLEDTETTDPKTGKTIRISTTVRLIYRKLYPQEYGDMRNARLNLVIAKDFVANANNVLHYFRLGSKEVSRTEHQPAGAEKGKVYANVAEIRGTSSSFYVSAIQDNSIDILTIQKSWYKPKYKGTEDAPMEMGDS